MAFKNLYALLGLSPAATEAQIKAAMKEKAQAQSIGLDDLKFCQKYLLDADIRKKYNAKLYAEFPEVLQQMVEEKAAAQAATKAAEPAAAEPEAVQKSQEQVSGGIEKVKLNPGNDKGDNEQSGEAKEPAPDLPKGCALVLVLGVAIVVILLFRSCTGSSGTKQEDHGFNRGELITSCQELSRKTLNFPESFDYVSDRWNSIDILDANDAIVRITFTGTNAFGVKQKFYSVCRADKHSMQLRSVNPE